MSGRNFIKHYWNQQTEIAQKIHAVGIAAYSMTVSGLKDAFRISDRFLRCIDEGCPGGVHLAGSGILLGMDRALAIARAAGVTAVTSHDECGAAKLAAEQAGLDEARADEYGRSFAAELAKGLGVSYCHLPMAEMARPAGLHIARVVYYDGTGRFDPSRCPGLPPGFVISRRYLTAAVAQQECRLAVSIAFGPHGFGERFTPEHPLLLIGIADPAAPQFFVAALRSELAAVASGFSPRFAVDGYTAPAMMPEHRN